MKRSILMLMGTFAIAAAAHAQAPDMSAARDAMMKACTADIKSLCADKQGREVMMCLRGNTDKVGASCKDAMSKMPARPAPPAP